jgi:hypothetical protein
MPRHLTRSCWELNRELTAMARQAQDTQRVVTESLSTDDELKRPGGHRNDGHRGPDGRDIESLSLNLLLRSAAVAGPAGHLGGHVMVT